MRRVLLPGMIPDPLSLPVPFAVLRVSSTILLPVTRIIFFPDLLALTFVHPVIRICLLSFPLPLALSCLLATLITAVTLLLNPWVPATYQFAAATSKGNALHNNLPGLVYVLPER